MAIFASKMNRQRSFSQRTADLLTSGFGTMTFLVGNMSVFAIWIFLNSGIFPGVKVIDPFPFFLLTTFVSLEAIFLSIIVLMSENRAARVAELREEIDFQVNVQAEREITKMLEMLNDIRKELKVGPKNDPELKKMMNMIDVEQLEGEIREEMG